MAIDLNLQRFAEGGAASGGDGGAPMATEQSSQQSEQSEPQMEQNQAQPGFRDIIKDPRYKQDADAWIKDAMAKRFRGHEQMQQQMQQMQQRSKQMEPIMSLIGQKYGKGADDIEGIRQALEDDDSIYEEAAAQAGLPVKTYKRLDQLEKENAAHKARQQQQQQEAAYQQHYQSLMSQEAELKQQFPNFELQKELQNEKFLRWTSPQYGMSVKDAYFAIHADEIQRQSMQYAGQKSAQAVMASVRSGALRPQENATGSNGMAGMRVDVRQMTEEQLDEIDRKSRIQRTTLW